jgi:hypothetical protein
LRYELLLAEHELIIKARVGLRDAQEIALSIDETASQFNWALYLSMFMSLVLAGLCLFMMMSLVCRMPNMMGCLHSRVVMPLFVLLLACSYIFSLVFVVASTATADICVSKSLDNNIDTRILSLFDRFKETLSPIVVEVATFYIQKYPGDILPRKIAQQLDYILADVPVIQHISAIVEEFTGLIQDVCGFAAEDSQLLVLAGEVVQVQLCEIAEILKRVQLFFQCENWFPLYETTVYRAFCYDGFAYVASTQFVIVCMAFVIVTLRAAFWEVQIGDEDRGMGTYEKDDAAMVSQGNTENISEEDLDRSGKLVLNHHQSNDERRATREDSCEESIGIEIELFSGRSDAWSVWARQFAGGRGHPNNDNHYFYATKKR